MAAFSYPQNSFLLDSSVLFQVPEFSEQPTNNISTSTCTLQFHHHDVDDDQSLTKKQSSDSSSISVVVDQNPPQIAKQFTQTRTSMDKRRKKRDGSPSTTTAQSMRITKKRSSKADHKKEKKPKVEKKVQKKKVPEEEEVKFTGYVHVRARRGEATDSHSLAERARREKISERMKLLQSLVPGCDKITGKAFVLDEIIGHVQSLQTQVEFLTMKLASVDPLCNDFGTGLDPLAANSEALDSTLPSQPSFQESNTFEAMPYGDHTQTSFNMASSYPILDSPQSLLQFDHHLMEMELPNILHQDDFEQLLWDMDGQRQKQSHHDQYGFTTNLCSFH